MTLARLANLPEAIRCFDRVLEREPNDASVWFNKALAEDKIGRGGDAVRSYTRFIALTPGQYANQIEHARRRLRELEGS